MFEMIKHFDIKTPKTIPPEHLGWTRAWHGYYEISKCESVSRKEMYEMLSVKATIENAVTEDVFERDCLMTILQNIKNEKVIMIEAGAGWGRISLALAGITDYKLIPNIPKDYYCLAVEAEPTHYEWLKQHFEIQDIKGKAVFGAVSNKDGQCYFDTNSQPDNEYGQRIVPIIKNCILSPGGILRAITNKSTKVPMFTVDSLIKSNNLSHVDILDVDVQGNELNVVLGALKSLSLIDYLMIGTHHRDFNRMIIDRLNKTHNAIVNLLPDTTPFVDCYGAVKLHDGILILQRKMESDPHKERM